MKINILKNFFILYKIESERENGNRELRNRRES